MIRVNKDLNNIPASLLATATIAKRKDCIRNSRYKQDKNFNRRFKQRDTRVYLKRIYNKKCAFCEQKVIDSVGTDLEDNTSTIEHYRPKGVYYWLAYSWDNLLWCCHRCNKNKDNKFNIVGTQVSYRALFLNQIHHSVNSYNITEQPKVIHPELENVINQCDFNTNGVIDSCDIRVKYTIETCGLDRDDLNEKRKEILDQLRKKVNDEKFRGGSTTDVMREFIRDMNHKCNEFIAFRYWVLRNIQTLV